MNKTPTLDMTEGKVIRVLLVFTIPIFISNLFQQFYNLADSIIVGRLLGVNAFAAVGSTGALSFLVLGFALGGNLRPQSAAGIPVLLFLAFISGAGYVLWALLMKNNPVSRISVFGLIIPVMNVLLSALLNGEPLFQWNYLAALVLVCGGIFLVNRAPRPRTE